MILFLLFTVTLGQGGGVEEEKELDFAELWLILVQELKKQNKNTIVRPTSQFVKVKQEMPTKIENNVFMMNIIGIFSQNLLIQRFWGISYTESCIM